MVAFYFTTKHFHKLTKTSSVTFFSSLSIYTYIGNKNFLALLKVIDNLVIHCLLSSIPHCF